jgi:Peptidase S46
MKKSLLLSGLLLVAAALHAQEGMWMLNTLKQVNEADMQRLGFKLTADDVYNVNASSMKDAVARLGGGFCSGEIVSAEGLMLTNHHCGFEAIQSASSVEHDYLTNGFWAMTRDQELPAGFYVSFLSRIDDVTSKVLAAVNDGMSEEERQGKIAEVGATLEQEAVGDAKHMSADFKTMYEGNEFYVFVYKDFPDVRMVGAPPSAIGKFGGDTDNWMWPRHTGDFSMFRVYTGPDGEPAEPAKDNIPYKPKYWFPVSLDGVKQGDFSMVMGCPGSTDRFLSSQGVKLALDTEQPSRVKIRGRKLDLMKEDMDASDAVRIKYAAKYAQVSNYWKYFIGQQRGLKRLHVYDKKKQHEGELTAWINGDAARKAKYGAFNTELETGYAERAKYEEASTYMQEAAFGCEGVLMGMRMMGLYNQLKTDPKDAAKIAAGSTRIQGRMMDMWKDYNPATDQKITAAMFRMIGADVDPAMQPTVIKDVIQKKFKGDYEAWAAAMFKSSILCDSAKMNKFLAKPSIKVLEKDLGFQAAQSSLNVYQQVLGPAIGAAQLKIDKGYRLMVAAMREREPNKMWYPNANSTIRCSYGQVGDYTPGDAMHYDFVTTADGILEKEDNTNEEFVVPARQHELLSKKDYGRYADEKGELITCFISKNDITGGNSGSPVINGKGELIGIAFDGNWEAMSGDIAFEPELQRTISVDIRYVLWTIDKFAGAKHLVDEMTLKTAPKEQVVVPAIMPEVIPVPKGKATVAPVKKG